MQRRDFLRLGTAGAQDAEQVAPRLAERRPGLDVVLTPAEHACSERLADRINAMT